jgi:hypothetical protein
MPRSITRRRNARAKGGGPTSPKPPEAAQPAKWHERWRTGIRASETAVVFGLWTAGIAATDLMFVGFFLAAALGIGLLFIFEDPLRSPIVKVALGALLLFFLGGSGWIAYERHQPAPEFAALKSIVQEQTRIIEQNQRDQETRNRLSSNPAALTPGNTPSPDGLCLGSGVLNIILGDNVFGVSHFPFVAIQLHGKPLIILDRNKTGGVFVTMDIKDKYGVLLTRVVRNSALVIPSHATSLPRTSEHQLIVINELGDKVIEFDYINENVMKVTGVLYTDGTRISIDDNAISLDGGPSFGANLMCEVEGGLVIN